MNKPVNKTLIGLFVVGSIVLCIGFVILLGSGKFFTEKRTFVMYFEGSIRGLAIGSPVTFKGIKIGSVKDIMVRADTSDLTFTFPVYIEIELERFTIEGQHIPFIPFFSTMNQLIEKGLKAQLQPASLVTGQLMVELDFHPDMPTRLHGHDLLYPEIPTIKDNINELAEKIEKIPVELFSAKILSIIERVDDALQSSEIKDSLLHFSQVMADLDTITTQVETILRPLSENASFAINDFRNVMNNLDQRTSSLEQEMRITAKAATAALHQATNTLQEISETTSEDSALVYRLGKTLEDLSSAANSIRSFTDYFAQHPESLFMGKSN